MARMTSKDEHGNNVIITSENWCYSEKSGTLKLQGCIADKLAAYENTYLSPEEINDLKSENVHLRRYIDELCHSASASIDCLAIKADNERLHRLVDFFENVVGKGTHYDR